MSAVVLYASSQGTSKTFAERFGSELGIPIVDAKTLKPEDLQNYTKIIWSVSSYGKGKAPKLYRDWWDTVEACQLDISQPHCAARACGSTDFANTFVNYGKTVEKKMLASGAQKIAEMGRNDAAGRDSSDVEEFIKAIKQ